MCTVTGNSLVVLTPSGDVMDCATISRAYVSTNTLTFTASRSTKELK